MTSLGQTAELPEHIVCVPGLDLRYGLLILDKLRLGDGDISHDCYPGNLHLSSTYLLKSLSAYITDVLVELKYMLIY